MRRPSSAPAPAPRLLNRALLFAGALLLLFVAVQLAPSPNPGAEGAAYADSAGTVAAKAEPARERGPSLFSPGYLAAIALLAGGGYLALHLRRTRGGGDAAEALAPLGALALGPNASARLVRCGDDVLLLGVAGGSVTLLKTYPADAFADAPAANAALAGPAFADVLQRYAPSVRPSAVHAR